MAQYSSLWMNVCIISVMRSKRSHLLTCETVLLSCYLFCCARKYSGYSTSYKERIEGGEKAPKTSLDFTYK
jgi:hypothetical protein